MPYSRFPLTLNRYALSIVRYLIMKLRQVVLFILLLAQWQCYAQASDTTVTILPLQKLSICPGDTLHAHYTVSKRFQSGNTFLAELSSTSGNFATGTLIIGSYTSDTNGIIVCSIPVNIASGNAYRIRIITNKPTRTSLDNGVDITIKTKPSIAPASVKVCQGNIITLNAHSTTPGAITTWSGPLSYTSSGSPAAIAAAQLNMAGRYYATTQLNGCISYDSLSVTVNPLPIALLTTNSPVCIGDTMHLNMNWQPHTTNLLKFPGGLVITNNANYSIYGAQPAYAGTYMLVVTDTNNCRDTAYRNFAVKPLPDTPEILSNSPICTGKKLQFFGLPGSSTSASFIWNGPGGYTSVSPTPFINNATIANAGVYTLRTYYNGCYSATVTDTVTIVDKPEKPEGSSNSPLCEGDGMQLTAKDVNGAYFLWIGPNNFKSNIQNPFLPFASKLATGYYILQDSISGGCVNTDTIYVEVNPYPQKTQIIHNAPVCDGDTLIMNAVEEYKGTKYLWWGAAMPNDTTAIVKIADMRKSKTGMYGVVANYKGCITIGDTIYADTKPVPEQPIAKNNGPLWEGQELMLTADCATPDVKYLWSGPSGYTDTGKTVYVGNITKAVGGNYFVTADKDGCLSTNSTTVDVRSLSYKNEIAVILYPSPNDGNFWLDVKTAADQIMPVRIYNLSGQLMHSISLQTGKKFLHHQFLLKGHLAGGKYYLVTLADGKEVHIPFAVNRQ